MDDIYYAILMNKILWDQGVYQYFVKMDEDSKHNMIVKGNMVGQQQRFSKVNLKAMKVAIDLFQKDIPKLDEEAIKRVK